VTLALLFCHVGQCTISIFILFSDLFSIAPPQPYLIEAPDGWRISGDGGEADGVRGSRGSGGACREARFACDPACPSACSPHPRTISPVGCLCERLLEVGDRAL
jgi:hypothetical protein